MQEQSFTQRGAVDLSGIAAPSSSGTGGAAPNGASYVIEVTEETFQTEVINRSVRVPVLIDFWADWCGPCKQLSPILERLAGESGGRWVLAKIDVDANQRVAAAFSVQGIPAVFAVVKGQPLPLFTGALPEANVRQFIDELLRVAVENGVSGTVPPLNGQAAAGAEGQPTSAGTAGDAQPVGPPSDPDLDAAAAAIEAGDLDAAIAAYEKVLANRPDDAEVRSGLAAVQLVKRTNELDESAVRK